MTRPSWSLSARRAWIEIRIGKKIENALRVALRKESVDRNYAQAQLVNGVQKSLSARRAWIEIGSKLQPCYAGLVALRKESVDRNIIVSAVLLMYS